MIIGQKLGSYATVSLNVLPAAQQQHLGGREVSKLN